MTETTGWTYVIAKMPSDPGAVIRGVWKYLAECEAPVNCAAAADQVEKLELAEVVSA